MDFSANYVLPVDEKMGKIAFDAVANLTLKHEFSTGAGRPFVDYTGNFTLIQGLIPEYNITLSLTYQYEGLTFVTSAHYLPETLDQGNLFPEYNGTEHGLTLNGQAWKIPDYYTIDMQLSYEFGKNKLKDRQWYDGLRLTVGCNNITDERPPLIPDAVEDTTDKNNYDILGRFFYFEISKKF